MEEPGLHVRVERGEVRLSGKLQRRSEVELLEALAARVPGVVAVRSTLRWAWDGRREGGLGRTSSAFRVLRAGGDHDRETLNERRPTMNTIVVGYDDTDPAKRALSVPPSSLAASAPR